MASVRDGARKEDDAIPLQGLEKASVIQQTKKFNETPINISACRDVMSKLLYILSHGEFVTRKEATEVYMNATMLFQSKDIVIRRLLYVILKELSHYAEEGSIIIAVNSLAKDVNGKQEIYRAAAIRTLVTIADPAMLGPIERYMKQAVVDRSALVSSAALISGIRLLSSNTGVRRWVGEVQEALNSRSNMVQYHALALLYRIREGDARAIAKLVSQAIRASLRSPLAHCLLIRYTAQVLKSGYHTQFRKDLIGFLESSLRNKNEMVIFEAARALTLVPDVTAKELSTAVNVLQLLLTSLRPVTKFAAIRTLNKIAMLNPSAVTGTNLDLESLISDSNRSIATLAITTLLKIGSEGSVDKLLSQIGTFMSDLSDEFRIIVVLAMRDLSMKYPQKARILLGFLSNAIRDEGGFEYKKVIVDTIFIVVGSNPSTREAGLNHLCEFIEDCEFPSLAQQVLQFLAKEGPDAPNPGKYIRYICNRLLLENASVRASCVNALLQFGIKCPNLRSSIIELLKMCLLDNDDEVRDRDVLSLDVLQREQDGEDSALKGIVSEEFDIPLSALEKMLTNLKNGEVEGNLDLQRVRERKPGSPGRADVTLASTVDNVVKEASHGFSSIPELAALGKVLASSPEVLLTEEGTEYGVKCIKHVFGNHVVLEYVCTNTVEDLLLERVHVETDLSAFPNELSEEGILPIHSLEYGTSKSCFVILSRKPNAFPIGTIGNLLKFVLKETDGDCGDADMEGMEDTYNVEGVDLGVADYLQPHECEFDLVWDEIGEDAEVKEWFELGSMGSVAEASDGLIELLRISVYSGSGCKPNSKSHTVKMSGICVNSARVLVTATIFEEAAVCMKLSVRCEDVQIGNLLIQSIS